MFSYNGRNGTLEHVFGYLPFLSGHLVVILDKVDERISPIWNTVKGVPGLCLLFGFDICENRGKCSLGLYIHHPIIAERWESNILKSEKDLAGVEVQHVICFQDE